MGPFLQVCFKINIQLYKSTFTPYLLFLSVAAITSITDRYTASRSVDHRTAGSPVTEVRGAAVVGPTPEAVGVT